MHIITIYVATRACINLWIFALQCLYILFYLQVQKDGDFGGFVIMRLSDGKTKCRDQLRRQGDQGTRRARVHILSLLNIKNSMGLSVREGQSRAASSDRRQRSATVKL